MNDRKKHVMEIAHTLFVEKGFMETSVQEILEKSGISKGTFYNYFPSKKELLINIFEKIQAETERRRIEVLAGKKKSDKNAFIKQIQVKMEVGMENKLFALFNSVLLSEDEELKKIVQRYHLDELKWLQQRIVDIFGQHVQPYSLDLAVLFYGMLHNALHFSTNADVKIEIDKIITYMLNRIDNMVPSVIASKEQLFDIQLLTRLNSKTLSKRRQKIEKLFHKIDILLSNANGKQKELLLFLKEELQSPVPRKAVIQAVLKELGQKKDLEILVFDVIEE
ncbi:TetR/AcrR family transcriptional regulator [Fervidibacillus halotolerans]|uniref:TetR/AcrR family transcriptional regulator n=1 Tax=Fervidibacillus halotolerans TaxID=2980027 RepID=A0A9E8M1B6_9BACI|nr:TetR/AcrR family transcriptional regulator [Fervidibacillus halotolerans]WAA12686.1 TetR/AcrR family transcriptional regulator [Fervidibacillus halotolerans]